MSTPKDRTGSHLKPGDLAEIDGLAEPHRFEVFRIEEDSSGHLVYGNLTTASCLPSTALRKSRRVSTQSQP